MISQEHQNEDTAAEKERAARRRLGDVSGRKALSSRALREMTTPASRATAVLDELLRAEA